MVYLQLINYKNTFAFFFDQFQIFVLSFEVFFGAIWYFLINFELPFSLTLMAPENWFLGLYYHHETWAGVVLGVMGFVFIFFNSSGGDDDNDPRKRKQQILHERRTNQINGHVKNVEFFHTYWLGPKK